MSSKNENPLKGAMLEGMNEQKPAKNTSPKKSSEKVDDQKANQKDLWKSFEANLDQYTGTKGQGTAVWLPNDIVKRMKIVSAEATRNLPIRAMAAAMTATFLDEFEKKMRKL